MTIMVVIDPLVPPGATNDDPPKAIEHQVKIHDTDFGENGELSFLQDAVGGYIEYVRIEQGGTIDLPLPGSNSYYLLNVKSIVVNEDGLMLRLPVNHLASIISASAGGASPLVGPVVIIADVLAEHEGAGPNV